MGKPRIDLNLLSMQSLKPPSAPETVTSVIVPAVPTVKLTYTLPLTSGLSRKAAS